ncbi:MAG: ATP-dependent helicase, partial [Flavobacterium sp.]
MASPQLLLTDNNIDDHVDDQIANCLNLHNLQSFFLFAGAGSGKTRTLVKALETFCKKSANTLRVKGKKVGVITFTNAACNEIVKRLNFNPLLDVSTIHSFVWNLIKGYNQDIKKWLQKELEQDLIDLKAAQAKGRASKAYNDRERSIALKTKKLEELPNIKKFVYNPNGDNKSKASLTHADVIKIGADFLNEKPLLQSLLISQYPIILIDESQDTNKNLMDAFLKIQKLHPKKFCLGLIGDTMQRIYSDGKSDLEKELSEDWAKPV